MSVETTSAELSNTLNSFEAARATITQNKMYSDIKKSSEQGSLRDKVLDKVEALAIRLWGGLLTDPETSEITLDEQGEVWTEMAGHEAALSNARSEFQKSRFGDDDSTVQVSGRAASLVRIASTQAGLGKTAIERFWELYENESIETKHFLMEAGASLLPADREWGTVISQLERSRSEELDKVLAPVQSRIDTFMQSVVAAHATSQKVANEFGRDSSYLITFLAGVQLEKHTSPSGISHSLDRRPVRAGFTRTGNVRHFG